MPYGHKAGDTRVYEFGVPRTAVHHGLLVGQDKAIEEMCGQVTLWNWLVEVEKGYRKAKEFILAPYPPQPVETVDKSGKLRKVMKRILPLEAIDALRALDRRTTDAVNEACTTSGLYSWHYTDVKLRWLAARAKFDPPKFHRWDGNEKVTTWLSGGMPVDAIWTGNTLLRCERGAYEGDVLVHLRIATDEHRRPVWMTLPMRMHRPLLPGGLIRSVSAVREMVGPTIRWKVLFCVESKTGWRTCDAERHGAIGIDIGWRQVPCPCDECKARRRALGARPGFGDRKGLRVAAWHDDQGQAGEVVLHHDYLDARDDIDDLQGNRALAFNAIISDLRAFVKSCPAVSDWLREESRYCHQWKRYGKLVRLLRMWDERRFDGDAEIVRKVRDWSQTDHWAWQKEADWLDKRLRDRRERYRLFAAWVASTYESVMIEDFDLSEVARVKKDKNGEKGKGAELPEPVRHNRQLAGVYQLRLALKNACEREGVSIILREPAGTTMICSACGSVEHYDQAAELRHTCEACGANWDQDDSAAINILRDVHLEQDAAG